MLICQKLGQRYFVIQGFKNNLRVSFAGNIEIWLKPRQAVYFNPRAKSAWLFLWRCQSVQSYSLIKRTLYLLIINQLKTADVLSKNRLQLQLKVDIGFRFWLWPKLRNYCLCVETLFGNILKLPVLLLQRHFSNRLHPQRK